MTAKRITGCKPSHAQHKVSQKSFADFQKRERELRPTFDVESVLEHRSRNRLLRRRDVEARTGLSRSTIYDWMKRGKFPQPVKLGERIVAWRESEVTDWLESREVRGA